MQTAIQAKLMAYIEPEPNSGCWLWTASVRPLSGYGQLRHAGKIRFAHRVAYEAFRGRIPDGLFVCHHCDTRSCINPDHLFLGTGKDNAQDMIRKGRQYCQRRSHCFRGHKLTPDNTYLYADQRRGLVRRSCRICLRNARNRWLNARTLHAA